MQYSTVQCIKVQYSTAQYIKVQYSTVQYNHSEGILSLGGDQVVSFTSNRRSLGLSGPQSRVDALMKTNSFNLGRNRTTVSRMTISYCISFVKLESKGHLRTSRRRIWENNRQMNMVCEDVNWNHLAQDMNQCPATVTAVQKRRVL